jgi:hypothetical protein
MKLLKRQWADHLDAPFPQGIALLAARSTRLPIYTAFAKHGNVGDLYAKGEALSVLSNVAGMWLGIQLASGVCGSVQGKVRFRVLGFLGFHPPGGLGSSWRRECAAPCRGRYGLGF